MKVAITITVEDSGQINFAASTKNLITILGLLDIARDGFLKKMTSEKSDIVVPGIRIN